MSNAIEYTPPPTVRDFIAEYTPGELFFDWILGPVGCVAPDTLIRTEYGPLPISEIDRPMRVLSWNERTCRFQLSWCGSSFQKGTDYLYRVSTPQGEFDAAGQHLCLCADGEYRRVESLRPGDVLAACSDTRLQTSLDASQSGSPAGAQRSMRIPASWWGRCAGAVRLYGRRLLQGADSAPEPALQPSGAHTSSWSFGSSVGGRGGGLKGPSQGRSHQDRRVDQTGTGGCPPQAGHLQEAEAYHTSSSVGGRIAAIARQGLRFLRKSASHRSGEGSVEHLHSCGYSRAERPILAITRREVKQEYWDIQVGDTHNYVTTDGAIHHNSGKTTGIFFKLVYMAALQAKSPRDGIRRSRAVIVRNTMPQLRDTTITSWNYWFKDPQAGSWRASENKFILKFNDVECEVLFRPLDTPDDVARVLSLEVTFAVLDEFVQIDKAIVEALSARCGRYPPEIDGGATNWGMWGSSNPGNEDSWWHEKLEEDKPSNWTYFKQPSGFSEFAENVANLPGKARYYSSLAEGKSEHWIKQFIEVCWGYSLDGTPVLKTFLPHLHIASRPLVYNPYLPLVSGFDPGLSGSAFILGQMDMDGRLHVLSELVQTGYGADRLCTERLRPHLRLKYPTLKDFVIAPDPAANNRGQGDEKTVVHHLKVNRFKVEFPDMNNHLETRMKAIEYFTGRLTPKGPALVIDPSCKTLIQALQTGWRYKVKRDGEQTDEPEKNKHSHPADAFGYLCKFFAHTDPAYTQKQKVRMAPVTNSGYHAR